MNLLNLKNYLCLVNPDTEKYCFLLRKDSLSIFNRTDSTAYIISILIKKGIEEDTFDIFSEDNHLSNYFSWLYDVARITLVGEGSTREHTFQNYTLELKD